MQRVPYGLFPQKKLIYALIWCGDKKKIPDKNENIPRRTSTDLKNLLAVFFHANCENFVIPVATDTSSQSVVFGDKDSKETPD